jgi:hypothetical protein
VGRSLEFVRAARIPPAGTVCGILRANKTAHYFFEKCLFNHSIAILLNSSGRSC